ncbi:hypothetical protein HPHPP15B_0656 [Helicobacter pylori Hp P-15b]|uniref:Uncharacterized protein n=1 Tax=Helicobacter pylori Hp P-15 TaxID=992080 RepID=J0Q5S8_HELPX|nr:hypothetical protein HPHPP15_1534 [Helicobacter pylori Hp P-15]EJC31836.1 hypothetical protein HPHPP15B_0656 [Helicobacter pylori Hp P-15b]
MKFDELLAKILVLVGIIALILSFYKEVLKSFDFVLLSTNYKI